MFISIFFERYLHSNSGAYTSEQMRYYHVHNARTASNSYLSGYLFSWILFRDEDLDIMYYRTDETFLQDCPAILKWMLPLFFATNTTLFCGVWNNHYAYRTEEIFDYNLVEILKRILHDFFEEFFPCFHLFSSYFIS